MTSRKLLICLAGLAAAVIGCSAQVVRRDLVQTEPEASSGILEPAATSLNGGEKGWVDPVAYNYYVDAVLQEALGNPYRASESYRKALRYYPDSYVIRFSLSDNLYRMQRFEDALVILGPIKPQDADVWELRGDIYRGEGWLDSAVAAYVQAVHTDSTRFEVYSFLASVYSRDGDIDRSVWAFSHLARLDPENYAVWLELGRLFARRGETDSARTAFARSASIRADALNVTALIGLGELLELEEDYDSAATVYRRAVQVDSSNIVAHRNLAGVYVQLDSLEQALGHARIEARLAPLDRQSARRLGMLYYYLDSLEASDSVFTALVDGGERNPLNHQYLGRIAMRQSQPQVAVQEFALAVQMADSSWDSWLDLGLAYRAIGNQPREIEAYQKGLDRADHPDARGRLMMALGSAYEQSGKFDSAVAIFEVLITESPEYDLALNYLGYMLADSGQRLDYARSLIERALAINPNNAAYLDSYGWVSYRLGELDQAREYLERAVALDSDPVIFDHLGDTYQALGNSEEAQRWWQKALELDPDNARVRSKLGP